MIDIKVESSDVVKTLNSIDPFFRVEVVSRIPNPQQVIYAAMHQDYSESFVYEELGFSDDFLRGRSNLLLDPHKGNQLDHPYDQKHYLTEEDCGGLVVKHLLGGNRGHFGPLEHPQIILNCGWFPHSTMQQVRTHRVGISFDCQSFRYSGQRIVDAAEGRRKIEEVFYLRPVGYYTDRQGKSYEYVKEERNKDLDECLRAAKRYANRVGPHGFSEEHARSMIPFDVRQHWVVSVNVRSLMHLLDLRWKADAQLECQQLCDLIWPHFQSWLPAIADWYEKNRAKKARLAP